LGRNKQHEGILLFLYSLKEMLQIKEKMKFVKQLRRVQIESYFLVPSKRGHHLSQDK
jgi:hypothetical protein